MIRTFLFNNLILHKLISVEFNYQLKIQIIKRKRV